jgi:hypothetical protein
MRFSFNVSRSHIRNLNPVARYWLLVARYSALNEQRGTGNEELFLLVFSYHLNFHLQPDSSLLENFLPDPFCEG